MEPPHWSKSHRKYSQVRKLWVLKCLSFSQSNQLLPKRSKFGASISNLISTTTPWRQPFCWNNSIIFSFSNLKSSGSPHSTAFLRSSVIQGGVAHPTGGSFWFTSSESFPWNPLRSSCMMGSSIPHTILIIWILAVSTALGIMEPCRRKLLCMPFERPLNRKKRKNSHALYSKHETSYLLGDKKHSILIFSKQ